MRPVVLLTDFGHADHYVGVVHAVLERELPGVVRLDLGHEVAPGDVWAACHLLRSAWPWLPADAVVLVVVDPGVGSARLAAAVTVGARSIVAPDNGILCAVEPPQEAVAIDPLRMGVPRPSRTFHGRDLFAPAAARLAAGCRLSEVGSKIPPDDLVRCPLPEPERRVDGWCGAVVHVDRFGNVITNIPAGQLGDDVAVSWDGGRAGARVRTYAQAAAGEVVWLAGSSGLLEVAVNGASAAAATGLHRGRTVTVAGATSVTRGG